jgi:hypothetical protein
MSTPKRNNTLKLRKFSGFQGVASKLYALIHLSFPSGEAKAG